MKGTNKQENDLQIMTDTLYDGDKAPLIEKINTTFTISQVALPIQDRSNHFFAPSGEIHPS